MLQLLTEHCKTIVECEVKRYYNLSNNYLRSYLTFPPPIWGAGLLKGGSKLNYDIFHFEMLGDSRYPFVYPDYNRVITAATEMNFVDRFLEKGSCISRDKDLDQCHDHRVYDVYSLFFPFNSHLKAFIKSANQMLQSSEIKIRLSRSYDGSKKYAFDFTAYLGKL